VADYKCWSESRHKQSQREQLVRPVVGPSSVTEEIVTSTDQMDKYEGYITHRLHEQ